MGNDNYLVVDIDLKDELNKYAAENKPTGATEPLFQMKKPWPFQPSYTIDSKQFKRIEEDALLRSLLAKVSDPHVDKLKLDLRMEASKCSAKCKNGAATKEELDELWKAMLGLMKTSGTAILTDCKPKMETYLKDRTLGKIVQQKYTVKKITGILKVTAGVTAIGGAIAGAIASFGASSPTVAVAVYGTYKAVRETQQTFKKAARSHEKYAKSIEKTLAELKEKYDGLTPEEQQNWTAANESKAKIGKELLGFTGQSIKKLDESISGYDKAIELGFYAQSRLGKKVGRLKKEIEAAETEYKDLEAAYKQQGGDTDKARDKLEKFYSILTTLRTKADDYLRKADTTYQALEAASGESAKWKQLRDDLKAFRPEWVQHVSKPFKIVPLAAAVAAQDLSDIDEIVEPIVSLSAAAVETLANQKKKKKDK